MVTEMQNDGYSCLLRKVAGVICLLLRNAFTNLVIPISITNTKSLKDIIN